MSSKELTSGAIHAVGSNLADLALHTPQGQAALAVTVAAAAAAAPVMATGAVVLATGYVTDKIYRWMNS